MCSFSIWQEAHVLVVVGHLSFQGAADGCQLCCFAMKPLTASAAILHHTGHCRTSTGCLTGATLRCRLPWNRCGCVYQLEVDADFVATQMYSLICGNNVTNTDRDNKCDINSIAAPDNLSMMRGHNQMIIGEDTDDHQNDVVWLYSFDVSFVCADICSCSALLYLLAISPPVHCQWRSLQLVPCYA